MVLSHGFRINNLLVSLSAVMILLCSCNEQDCATCPTPQAPTPTGWFVQNTPTTLLLNSIHAIDSHTVVAAGAEGTIMHTTNGGNTWAIVTSGTTELLRALSFIGDTGWVVGDASTVLKTLDGGATWAPLSIPGTPTLRDVFFVDQNTGWISGGPIGAETGDTVLLKTLDGGATWIPQVADFTVRMMCFVDADSGCAAGGNNLARTTDGGETWDACDPVTTGWFSSIYFVDALHGWTSGGAGFVGVTTDGGRTWSAQASGTTRNVLELHFVDQNTGWYVGRGTNIATTVDGGITWTFQTCPTASIPSDLSFVDANVGWICGQDGMILKTLTGGR